MPTTSPAPVVPSLKEQLVREACSMVRHLVTNGTRVPAQIVHSTDQFEVALAQDRPIDMAALASTHERLSRLVAPAKPGTLYLLDYSFHQGGRWASLGPVTLVRDMVKLSLACVVVFILLSVHAVTEAHPDIQVIQWPVARMVMERIFWLSAAGIGASFAMLFQLNDQVVSRTYDPDQAASYWVKFFLGLVAGFILVALVPISGSVDTSAEALGPPTIALLGGFSASAVYRVLTRMVEALESVFSGGAREQTLAAEKAAVTRAAEETTQARMNVAGQLVQLQQRVTAGMSPQELTTQLQDVVAGLVPSENAPTPPPDKVPALVVVSAPAQDDAGPADTAGSADGAGAPAAQPSEETAAVG